MRSWKFSKSLCSLTFFRKGSRVLIPKFDSSLSRDANSTVSRLKCGAGTVLPMNLCGSWRTPPCFFLSVKTWVFVDVNQLFPWFSQSLWQRRSPRRWMKGEEISNDDSVFKYFIKIIIIIINNDNLILILRAFHEMIKRALHDFYL